LSLEEFKVEAKKQYPEASDILIKQQFDNADKDNNSKMSFEEFKALIKSVDKLKE